MRLCLSYLIVLCAAAAACHTAATPRREAARTLPFYDTADFTPKWPIEGSPVSHRIRPFRLVDQQNAPFTEADLGGPGLDRDGRGAV